MVIAAPTGLHADLIELCVAAGLPTFCEKPVARDSDEAARLARRVADAGVQVQIGYPRRFDPAFAAARAAVADGDLGVVHTVRSTTLDPAPPPRAYLAASGGIFRDCAVHDFDAVRWVTGQEVTEVYAAGTNQDAEWFGELGDVHTASAVLTLDGGALAVVSNTRYNARGHDVRLEVHGTRDSLAAGLAPGLPLRSAEPGVSFPDGKPFTFFMDRLAEAFRAELAAFTEVVAGQRASPCTVADAIETGWVAEACTLSLREHRPVQIEEVRIP
jgi:myo-inositol 2-dehydrogenase/D-chiro-inositol 1-dehydrogenase